MTNNLYFAAFHGAKGGVLHDKRRHLAVQDAAFCKRADGGAPDMRLLSEVLQTLVHEVHVLRDVLVIAVRAGQRLALGVDDDVERLGVRAELVALQVAPLVADGAQGALLSVLDNLHGLVKRGLVVNVERYQDEVVVELVGHLRVSPNGGFHLATVDASEAREVNHDRLALGCGCGHGLLIVGEARLYLVVVEVEVLRVHRRSERADGLAGRAPEAGHHVNGERERDKSQHYARHGHGLVGVAVALELELAYEIEAERAEDDNPEGEEHLTVKQSPAVSEVGHREELEGERKLDEAEYNLDGVHPAA